LQLKTEKSERGEEKRRGEERERKGGETSMASGQ